MSALSDAPSSPSPTSPQLYDPTFFSPEESQRAEALVAWLVVLSAAKPASTFDSIAVNCVPLCTVLSHALPNLFSARDFFKETSATEPNITRHFRYNHRRLTRALATYYHVALPHSVPSAASSSASTDTLSDEEPNPLLLEDSSPCLTSHSVARLIHLSDHVVNEHHTDTVAITLFLAECVLCAATSCTNSDPFLDAVLMLPEPMQRTLAKSIDTISQPQSSPSSLHSNPDFMPHNLHHPPLANALLPLDENRPLSQSPRRMSLRGDASNPASPPVAIPMADFKALVAERDSLRRKFNAVDTERAQLLEEEASWRKNVDDLKDRAVAAELTTETLQVSLAETTKSLHAHTDSVRELKTRNEELELRCLKADSAEQLERNLKSASQRLEEMAAVRQHNTDLQSQLSAFRDNEARINKHSGYLELQLTRGNDRSAHLTTLTDKLSTDLEERDSKNLDLSEEIETLQSKLNLVTAQLEANLFQSVGSSKATASTTNSFPSGNNPYVVMPALPPATNPAAIETVQDNQSSAGATEPAAGATDDVRAEPHSEAPAEVDVNYDARAKKHVSDLLLDMLGVRVGWQDIVDCMYGVLDAMRDIEKSNSLEYQAASASLSQPELINPQYAERALQSSVRMSTEDVRRLRASHEDGRRMRASRQSVLSDANGRVGESGSDALSHLSFVPEFDAHDKQLMAKNAGGDEFDFAANRCNVMEIPLQGRQGVVTNNTPLSDEFEESSYTVTDTGDEEEESRLEHVLEPIEPMDGFTEERKSSELGIVTSRALEHEAAFIMGSGGVNPNGSFTLSSRGSAAVAGVRKTSLSLAVRGNMSRSTSHSETTSVIARQTRHDLRELQRTMETMRVERNSCASVSSLVGQLETARVDLEDMQNKVSEAEAESANLRREMNLMLKELDAVSLAKKSSEESGQDVVAEKERLIEHLEDSLRVKEGELEETRDKCEESMRLVDELRESEKAALDKLDAAAVIERAHELEITKLHARVEVNDCMASRLNTVMKRTEGLTTEVSRQRDSQIQTALDVARRDKELAEQARDEAKRVAQTHASMLENMKTNVAVNAVLSQSMDERHAHTFKKSTRFHEFWKRLLHRNGGNIDLHANSLERGLQQTHSRGTPLRRV